MAARRAGRRGAVQDRCRALHAAPPQPLASQFAAVRSLFKSSRPPNSAPNRSDHPRRVPFAAGLALKPKPDFPRNKHPAKSASRVTEDGGPRASPRQVPRALRPGRLPRPACPSPGTERRPSNPYPRPSSRRVGALPERRSNPTRARRGSLKYVRAQTPTMQRRNQLPAANVKHQQLKHRRRFGNPHRQLPAANIAAIACSLVGLFVWLAIRQYLSFCGGDLLTGAARRPEGDGRAALGACARVGANGSCSVLCREGGAS